MNIYKFEFPYGIGVVCAKDRGEAIKIMYHGDGRKEELCATEYGFSEENNLEDDEPDLVDISEPHIIAFHCG
jgi:hypothetical protein